jgi:hypothetical protein
MTNRTPSLSAPASVACASTTAGKAKAANTEKYPSFFRHEVSQSARASLLGNDPPFASGKQLFVSVGPINQNVVMFNLSK